MEFQTDLIDVHWSQQPDQYKRSDDQHQIELTLLKLPENYRTYIILRDVNALSYEEVALITNESTGQVKVGLYRARKRFREIYREMEDGE